MSIMTDKPAAFRGSALDLSNLSAASLDDIARRAALMRRVDRKYIVPVTTAEAFVEQVSSTHAALEIGDRRFTSYRSTYFDTSSLYSMRSHVQRRRRRWKVRQRWYVEDDLCRIETKTKNGRGETVKIVDPSRVEQYGRLSDADVAFVESVLSGHPGFQVDALEPCIEVAYVRSTLTDLIAGTRVTIDSDLEATMPGGRAWIDDDYVLIETKGGVVPAHADRVLTRLGARQRSFSKSVAATSLIRDDIHDNDVRSMRGASIHVQHAPHPKD